MSRQAKVVLVVRQEQIQKFLDLGFGLSDPEVYSSAIQSNNRVVSRSFPDIEPGFPVRFLQGKGLIFVGICQQDSIENPRVIEKYLLASDGEISCYCPAHGNNPCIPFDYDHKIDHFALRTVAEYLDCIERVRIRLQAVKAS